jgi:hypothetical protein
MPLVDLLLVELIAALCAFIVVGGRVTVVNDHITGGIPAIIAITTTAAAGAAAAGTIPGKRTASASSVTRIEAVGKQQSSANTPYQCLLLVCFIK